MRRATMLLTFAILFLGCGSNFTATKEGRVDLRPTPPAWASVKADGSEVCRMDNPNGPIPLCVNCPAGQVPWYVEGAGCAYRVSCIPDPCGSGARLIFEAAGKVSCGAVQ